MGAQPRNSILRRGAETAEALQQAAWRPVPGAESRTPGVLSETELIEDRLGVSGALVVQAV